MMEVLKIVWIIVGIMFGTIIICALISALLDQIFAKKRKEKAWKNFEKDAEEFVKNLSILADELEKISKSKKTTKKTTKKENK